MFPVSMQINL